MPPARMYIQRLIHQTAAAEAGISEDGIKGTIPKAAITRKLIFTLNWKTSQVSSE